MSAYVFDTRTATLDLKSELVFDCDLSNDGELLAVACVAGEGQSPIRVYATANESVVAEFGRGGAVGNGVAFSGDGQSLYFLVRDRDMRFIFNRASLSDGAIEQLAIYGDAEFCHSLARNRDGRFVSVLGTAVEVWDMQTREVIRFKEGADSHHPVYASFSADGSLFCTYGTVESHVIVFDLMADREIIRLKAPAPFGQQVILSPSGEQVAAVAEGMKGVFVYSVADGTRLMEQAFDENTYTNLLTFARDGGLLAFLTTEFRARRLPQGERVPGPEVGLVGNNTAAASAYDAPMLVFALGGHLCWVRLVEQGD
jgi:WD40 repeat protein